MKYKYVVGGAQNDFYLASYADIMDRDDIVYRRSEMDGNNRILSILREKHFSKRINSIVDLPGKSIWNSLYFKNSYDCNEKVCFILFARYISNIQYGMISNLRKRYPKCKIVCFFQDLVSTIGYKTPNDLKEYFDLILSFDHEDCEKYGFQYYPLVYSKVNIQDDDMIKESDLFFVGKAKNRFKEIIDIFEKCTNAGIRCDFHIVGVPPEQQIYSDRIDYCMQMPYEENLRRIKKCKCMLEIMQQGGHGYTLRYGEAIAFGRRLITNNSEISSAPFFRPEYISTFSSAEDFDTAFILDGEKEVDYHYIEQLSPIRLIEFVDAHI